MNSAGKKLIQKANKVRSGLDDNFRDIMVIDIYKDVETISSKVLNISSQRKYDLDLKIDRILTSPIWGLPIMFLLLMGVFWVFCSGWKIKWRPFWIG